MKLILSDHSRAFAAEWLKLKRTGIWWLCFGAAVFVPLINTIVMMAVPAARSEALSWDRFLEQNFSGFTGFFYPLFLVIIMLRLVYMEHRSDTWKLMETQPVSRLSIFLAKYEMAALLSLLTLAAFLLFSVGSGLLLKLALPKPPFGSSSIDAVLAIKALLRFWMASLGLLAVQYFIALLLKNFAWPMTIGLVAIIAGSTFAGLQILKWFPYAAIQFTSSFYRGTAAGSFLLPHEKLSILWALLFLVISYQYFLKWNVAKAFFKPLTKLALLMALLLGFALLFWWINRPVVLPKYGKTIVAGRLQVEKPADRIVILNPQTADTIAAGAVVNGNFHLQASQPVPAGIYLARAGGYSLRFFLSEGDSLFIDLNQSMGRMLANFGGNRIAENEWLKKNGDDSELRWLTENSNLKPEAYAAELLRIRKSRIEDLKSFTTIDNIRPADDFLKTREKLLTLEFLYYLDVEYPKTFAVYHPNEKLTYPASVSQLRREVDLNDPSLVAFPEVTSYVLEYLKIKTAGLPNRDSAVMRFLTDSIRSAPLRDALLVSQINERLNVVNDSVQRALMLQKIFPLLSQERYKKMLAEQATRLNQMQKGRPAPAFTAEALTGQQVQLNQLANRYLVIDVWATWCAPCKKEEPFFDELAQRYTSPRVAFVSISVDEDKTAWRREALFKSKRVMQLWTADEAFSRAYAINAIPRFMLIDPRGKIIHAKLPPPSDPEFEAILQKEIPALNQF